MYHNQFVASVKCGGRIMRENKEVVMLPFGADYSLLFKNLSTRRAKVGVTIDGEDVLGGSNLVVNSNEDYELERFIINGNLLNGPKFRFIEKTGQISSTRGDKVDDGIIRVTYAFELSNPPTFKIYPDRFDTYGGGSGDFMRHSFHYTSNAANNPQTYSSCNVNSRGVSGQSIGGNNVVPDSLDDPLEVSDVGITTKGAESNQSFVRTYMGLTGEEHAIILYLRGVNDSGKMIVEPVHVRRKNKCETCGQINNSNQKFCGGCGTNLDW